MPFAGIPFLISVDRSSSDLGPMRAVMSGANSPPRPSAPWHRAQICANCCLPAGAGAAVGFRAAGVCAAIAISDEERTPTTAVETRILETVVLGMRAEIYHGLRHQRAAPTA